jgi:adenylate cyclase
MAARVAERLAILCADVAGPDHPRHEGAVPSQALIAERRDAIARIIGEHQGRLVPPEGDEALIASLPEATAAVRAALDIQDHISRANSGLPAVQHVRYAIGIDCGEVTSEDETSGGPVADVARALQSVARAGTVLVSLAVFQEIKTRLHFVYRIIGNQRFTDLPYLVEAYQIKKVSRPGRRFDPMVWLRRPTAVAAVAGFVLLGLGGAWSAVQWLSAPQAPVPQPAESSALGPSGKGETAAMVARDQDGSKPRTAPAEVRTAAEQGAPADDQTPDPAASRPPSIAVLPMANAGDDPQKDYFSDGVTETLIRDLGRFPHLEVIAADSMFSYRGDGADPAAVGRELGVGYVLEGSTAHTDGEMVLTARLFDGRSGNPLWPKAYETRTSDPAAAQQDLIQRLLATVEGRNPDQTPNGGPGSYGTHSLQAYDYGLQWRDLFEQLDETYNRRARQAALRATELDSSYAAAYAGVAWTYMADYWRGWATDREAALEEALDWANRAVSQDPDDFSAQWALGDVRQARGEFGQAMEAYETALAINPSAVSLLQDLGTWMLPIMGRAEEGVRLAERAMRLNPRHPDAYDGNIAFNFYLLKRYDDAIEAVNRMQEPRFDHLLYLAASYAQIERPQEAQLVIATVLAEQPVLTVESFLETLPLQREADRDHLRAGLQEAGLPLER